MRLGEELKRVQESLLFLSAWDEEKIELESKVRGRGRGLPNRNDAYLCSSSGVEKRSQLVAVPALR